MYQFLYFILFFIGLIMIIKGSDWFIDSTVWAAEVFRIPQIIIGATIVSICTTLPETFVSMTAAIKGETDMAIGNAIGSIGVNTGLVMALLLIFAAPIIDNRKSFIHNSFFLITVVIIVWIVGFIFHQIGLYSGILLLLIMLLYILKNVDSARRLMDLDINYDIEDDENVSKNIDLFNPMPEGIAYDEAENEFDISKQIIIKKIIFFMIGISFVVLGSNLLVDNGIEIAKLLNVPPILIALIFTSIGTSLPELVTTITSIRKGAVNLGVGNIFGANILNIVQVIGLSAIISPISLGHDLSILYFQIPMVFIMVLVAIGFGIFQHNGYKPWNGIVLLAIYFVFLMVNLLREGTPFLGPLLF